MDPPTRPTLFDFHGIPMTKNFTDTWDDVQRIQARPDDILIATCPKAGTTWVSYILNLLYFGDTSIPLHDQVPFLERSHSTLPRGVDLVNQLTTTPRLIKTHLPVQFVPKSFWEQRCRIVYVARNAKDSAVSLFHFGRMNILAPEPVEWPRFLQEFTDGKVVFGSWHDHVNGWWKKKQTYSKIHYMFYEDLIEDTLREINKLCSFLNLAPSTEEKQQLASEVQFDKMKQNELANYSTFQLMDFKISPFMRKGKVGDWKNHFTVAQNEIFDEDYETKMKDPTLQFRTVI